MADHRELFLAAGMEPVLVDSVLEFTAGRDSTEMAVGLLSESVNDDPEEAKREARLAWWGATHTPTEYRRLLDAKALGAQATPNDNADDSGDDPDVVVVNPAAVWDEALQQFVEVDNSPVFQAATERAWEESWARYVEETGDTSVEQKLGKAWMAVYSRYEDKQDIPGHPVNILIASLNAMVERGDA